MNIHQPHAHRNHPHADRLSHRLGSARRPAAAGAAFCVAAGLVLAGCSPQEDHGNEPSAASRQDAVTSSSAAQPSDQKDAGKNTEGSGTVASTNKGDHNDQDSGLLPAPGNHPDNTGKGSEPLDMLPSKDSQLDVTSIRSAKHEGFDRVVVELSGPGTPGWNVTLTDKPLGDASGRAVHYEGAQAMVVHLRGTTMPQQDVDRSGWNSNTKMIQSLTDDGWFEGTHRFVIGLRTANPKITVHKMDNPKRLVIDIPHS